MAYFIRHTNNPEADLERGYSFVGYQLWSTKELALETLAENLGVAYEEDFDLDAFAEDNDHRVGQDNVTSKWGTVRSGLCAYAEYETLEEAQAALVEGDYAHAAGGDFAQFAVIYEGNRTFNYDIDGQDEGATFKPQSIAHIKVL
jgi:hypothetical protein